MEAGDGNVPLLQPARENADFSVDTEFSSVRESRLEEEREEDAQEGEEGSTGFFLFRSVKALERFYVLTVFCIIAFNQGLCWMTFSSVRVEKVTEYYPTEWMSFATVALMLNWGPILGAIVFPLQIWILSRPDGFYEACIAAMALTWSGAALRMVPTLFESLRSSWISLIFLHSGQILNAAAGPLSIATVSRLSAIWFPKNERTFSTSVALTANALGSNFAFILGPYVTSESGIGLLLYVDFVLACAPIICAVFHFPRRPANSLKRGESLSEGQILLSTPHQEVSQSSLLDERLSLRRSLRLLLKNSQFWLVLWSAAMIGGVATAWQGLLQMILKKDFEETTIGWLGFLNGIAANIGSVVVAFFSMRHRLMNEIVLGLLTQIISIGSMLALLETHSQIGVTISFLAAGLTYGLTNPLFFELAADLSAPVNEGITIGILVFIANIISCVAIFTAAYSPPHMITFALIGTMIFAEVTMLFVRKQPNSDQEFLLE